MYFSWKQCVHSLEYNDGSLNLAKALPLLKALPRQQSRKVYEAVIGAHLNAIWELVA